MMQLFEIVLLIPGAIALLLSVFVATEIVAAFLPNRKYTSEGQDPGPIAVVIPAHNEAETIGATLRSIQLQMRSGDRLIIVADNCTDDTASIVTLAGAECWERDDPVHRGKGYALQFGLDGLKEAPPKTVIFIDADCEIAGGALSKIARVSEKENRPVQALYLMKAPDGATPRLRVSEFAWIFLNHVRMRGLDRLSRASRFTGAGLGLPWALAEKLDIGSGEIVEDIGLTVDLAAQSVPPLLLLDAVVTSEFPTTDEAQMKQRARWEHGSQRLAATRAFPALATGLLTLNFGLCVIALDLFIPPILNLVAAIMLISVINIVAGFFGVLVPLMFSLSAMFIVLISIFAAWVKFGREALPLSSLCGLIPFLAAKRKVYNLEGRASAKSWTTTRSSNGDD